MQKYIHDQDTNVAWSVLDLEGQNQIMLSVLIGIIWKSNKKSFFIYDFEKLIALHRWSLRSLIPENHENNEPDRWIDVNRHGSWRLVVGSRISFYIRPLHELAV